MKKQPVTREDVKVDAKRCRHCGLTKGAIEFNLCSAASDRLQSWCRACQQERNAKSAVEKTGARVRQKRRKMKNGTSPVNISRRLYLLLAACAESEHETVDEYVDAIVRRHIKDHLIDYLVEM